MDWQCFRPSSSWLITDTFFEEVFINLLKVDFPEPGRPTRIISFMFLLEFDMLVLFLPEFDMILMVALG